MNENMEKLFIFERRRRKRDMFKKRKEKKNELISDD